VIAVPTLADKALILQKAQMLANVPFGSAKSLEQFPDEPLALEQHANDKQPQRMRHATQNSRSFVSML
jgi:hypothetical protein